MNPNILRKLEGIYSFGAPFVGIFKLMTYKYAVNPLIIIQSTLVISNFKGLSEILRDIRSSTYQICRTEEKNNLINHI